MIRPEELIVQLLLRHNCVIVPGFGGFVAQRVSATFDEEKGLMLPPRKTLLFNKQLINNDGLLTAELASRSAISFEDASKEVQNMVNQWNEDLSRGARVLIDKIGFLFYDQEKNLCFEQDRFFNLLLESFGLGKVHFTKEHIKEETKIIEFKPAIEQLKNDNAGGAQKGAAWKYLAAACIFPVAFYSFWIPTKTNVMESGMFSSKDFNPFFKNKPAVYKKDSIDAFRFNMQSDVAVSISENYEYLPGVVFTVEQDASSVFERNLPNNSIKGKKASKQFIVGCFKSQENVEAMLNRLHSAGLEAYVFDTYNGLSRVSAGGSDKESDILFIAEKVASLGMRGWVYRSN
jgi:hypothetical protein